MYDCRHCFYIDPYAYYLCVCEQINLVDVASHERWRLLNSNYFMKKADAVILLYSVTDIYTLYNLYEVVEDLRSYDKTSENTTWAVVGNKMDQNAEGTFFDKKVRDMMPQPELQTALAYLASAKTGENVDKIFTDVVKHMYKRKAALAPDTLYDDRAVRCPSGAKKRPGRSRGSTSNAVDYPLAFNRSSSRTVALSRTHKKHSKSSSCCV